MFIDTLSAVLLGASAEIREYISQEGVQWKGMAMSGQVQIESGKPGIPRGEV